MTDGRLAVRRRRGLLRGLGKLTWLEVKIFVREPMGVIGTVAIPVVVFLVLGRALGGRVAAGSPESRGFLAAGLPVFASLLIVLSAVTSLVTIMAIYREGGILKRLRATTLRPETILAAHVLVKLLFTAITMALLVLAGRQYYPLPMDAPILPFAAALLLSTLSVLSIGFLIASLVPTARFAQPISAIVLYPMVALSGLFLPIEALPPALEWLARALPMTYAVSLMQGIWQGEGWLAHLADAGALVLIGAACTALSARVFRWE